MRYSAQDMRGAYETANKLRNDDNCNVCQAPWGTMHSESCRFFDKYGGVSGHAAEVVARFLFLVTGTQDAECLVARFVLGMRRCKVDIGRDRVLDAIERVHAITDRRKYEAREHESDTHNQKR